MEQVEVSSLTDEDIKERAIKEWADAAIAAFEKKEWEEWVGYWDGFEAAMFAEEVETISAQVEEISLMKRT